MPCAGVVEHGVCVFGGGGGGGREESNVTI